MGRLAFLLASLIFVTSGAPVCAATWQVNSPDHRQTFSYGSERHRAWIAQGRHLAIAMEFTNDPYVDQINIRQYDDFNFNFPEITLGADGRTFFYHPRGKEAVAVAARRPGLLGTEISLLPSSRLLVEKRHGLLQLTILVSDSREPIVGEE